MLSVWTQSEPLPLLVLTTILLIGVLLVLVDLWWVRNDGLRGATSSKWGVLRTQLGLAPVSIGLAAFLFISPLAPQNWRSNEGLAIRFAIAVCFLYVLLACLHVIWRIIWIHQGFRRRGQ
jgi:hypothetical protein